MRRNNWIYYVAFAVVAIVAAGAAAADDGPQVYNLDNGLTVIVREMPSASVVCVRYYVQAGSIYEEEFLGAGISHYLEHLVGGGSESRSADEIENLQEELGNQTNAYTSSDHTCYFMTTANRFAEKAIDLIGDYVFHPLLSEQEIEKQRAIILREMAMGDDDPGRQLYYLLMRTMFRMHPSRYRVIGYPEPFKQITREDLVGYHARKYAPEKAVVVIAGGIDAQTALAKVKDVCGDLAKRAGGTPTLPAEPPQTAPRRVERVVETLHQAHLAIGYHTIDLFHPDLYALDVLDYILGSGPSSRLISHIREEKGLVDTIGCYSATPSYGAGRFVITATLQEENLQAAEEAIMAEIEALKTEPVTSEELSRAKKQKQAEQVYKFDSVESLASTIGSDYMATGDPEFSQHYADNIQKVTAEDVQQMARKYFKEATRTVVVRRPGAVAEEKVAQEADVEAATTRRMALPNGIVVLSREDNSVGSVHLQAAFTGGLRYETEQTAGIGRIMAPMLKRGTETRSRMDIAEQLDSLGAHMGTLSGRNSFNITARALAGDTEAIFDLLADCVRHPSFPEKELSRVKALRLAALEAKLEQPPEVASRLMLQKLFGEHPYALDADGTKESINAIDREALLEHYRRTCQPRRMVLSVYGDVDAETARALAAKYFGDWEPEELPPPRVPSQEPLDESTTVQQERPQEQAMVYYGFRGIEVDSEDRYALDVLDAAFSGVWYPGGRLHRTLRGEGLVYATHMSPVPGIDPGFVMVYAWTKPSKVETTREIMRQLISGVQSEPLPDEELQRAKKMCIAAHQVELGSIGDRVMEETLNELYGLGYDWSEMYPERIDAVTAAQVQAAARKYMPLDKCVLVVTRPEPSGTEGE